MWAYTVGTDGDPPSESDTDTIARSLAARGVRVRYYTPAVHRAAYALPLFVSELVLSARATPTSTSVPPR